MEELKLASTRQPRVALPSEAETRKLLSLPEEQKTVQDWERALATFPQVGRKQLDGLRSMESEGHLSPKIKAIIAWTSARNNHAIATLAVAKKRFEKLGISEADMAAIDQGNNLEPQEKLVALFAAKLTSHPQKITDQDIEQLREHFTDQQTAEIVYLIGAANMLDRLTETLSLRAL
jgi:alkylhydroperoxidase family enzyme